MDTNEGKDIKNEIKIIIIGNSNTGKTSFVNKWTKGTFTDFYKATVVSEFSHKIYQHKDKFYRIQLWDLAGQDQNTHITKIFSKNSHGCVVLCDITNKDSLNDTLKWKESVDESTRFIDNDILPSVLVQNKIDLVDEEALKDEEEIKKFAEDNKFFAFREISCKSKEQDELNNILEIFDDIGKYFYEQNKENKNKIENNADINYQVTESMIALGKKHKIKEEENAQNKKKKKCCDK